MVNTWFTSDTHFGHANIIKYSGRPFKTLDEMNKELIRRWNERVKSEDLVYFLGDFCFKNSSGGKVGEGTTTKYDEFRSQLNGDIVFIKGNHDYNNGIKSKINSCVLEFGGIEIFCCHNPADAHPDYKLNLCGHVHEKWKTQEREIFGKKTFIINVGVDQWKFYPVSLNEIIAEYNKYKINIEE